MTCLCIRRVCEAYKRDKDIHPEFRPLAAMPFDQRTYRFTGIDRVSLLTLEGRVIVPFVVGSYGKERLAKPKGQADLVLRKDGKWFLIVTVDVPEEAPIPVTDFIGVDLGIVNIATTSDGNTHSGADVDKVRKKHRLQKRRLQRNGSKGAKKKLQRIAKKESRFRKHENHVISKTIVGDARRTDRGIALEDLQGIADRVTARGADGRHRLKGWAFAQLRFFISYKAALAGVPTAFVDPCYTSQTCPECGHRERSNRKSQSEFRCKACSHEQHADVVGARNIRNAALSQDRALADPKPATGLVGIRGNGRPDFSLTGNPPRFSGGSLS
jgi:putative transposase